MEGPSLEQKKNPREELKRQLNGAIDAGDKEKAEQLLQEIFKTETETDPEVQEDKIEGKEELPEYGEIDLMPLVFGNYKYGELKVSHLVNEVQEKYGEGYHLATRQDHQFFARNESKLSDRLNKYFEPGVCYFFFDPSEYEGSLNGTGHWAITRFGQYDTRGCSLSTSNQHRDKGMRVLVLKDGWEQEFLNQG